MSLGRAINAATRRFGANALGLRQNIGSRRIIPAATKGLNSRDPYARMNEAYAVKLENYFPDQGALRLRNGYEKHAVQMGTGPVETLIPHYSGTVSKLFAAANNRLYDITAQDTDSAPTALVSSGITDNRWSHTSLGGHTVMVNGVDNAIRLQADGTRDSAHQWTRVTSAPGVSPVARSNVNANTFRRVMVFKNRLYLVQKDSAKVWYGGLFHVQGDLNSLDLSFVVPEGGNIVEIGTLTLDSGAGVDDLFLIFFQHGSVMVYSGGTDPAAVGPTGFNAIGKFRIGALVGDNPLVNVGGDLVALTVDGAIPMTELLKRGRSGQARLAISDAITPTIREAAQIYGDSSGWGAVLHPPQSWLLFSVPESHGKQFCMNTATGAWCEFTGMPARCWGRFNDDLFFGDASGNVFRVSEGHSDDGREINGDVQWAWNFLGSAHEKRITMQRAAIESQGSIAFQLGSTTDFGAAADLLPKTQITIEAAIWDEAVWDEAKWEVGQQLSRTWQAVNREGTAISPRIQTSTTDAEIHIYSMEFIYEEARGIL